MTHSILDRISEKNIKRDPLPRAIIENALPDDYYEELAQTFPSLTNVVGTSEGKKCHLPVDALGLILVIHPASIQDRDDALLVLDRHCRALFSLPRAHLRPRCSCGRQTAPRHRQCTLDRRNRQPSPR